MTSDTTRAQSWPDNEPVLKNNNWDLFLGGISVATLAEHVEPEIVKRLRCYPSLLWLKPVEPGTSKDSDANLCAIHLAKLRRTSVVDGQSSWNFSAAKGSVLGGVPPVWTFLREKTAPERLGKGKQ